MKSPRVSKKIKKLNKLLYFVKQFRIENMLGLKTGTKEGSRSITDV